MRHGNLAIFLVGGLFLDAQAYSDAQISGPYSHDNLSIFLIHQSNTGTGPVGVTSKRGASKVRYVALRQAMEQQKVKVYETKLVNEITIENLSDERAFLQQGDVVKGGQQDRMISNDFILPPKSGRLALAAFCVEQGRWSRRGDESLAAFSGSTELGAVRFDLKTMWNQMSVWETVSALQDALSARLRKPTGTGLAALPVRAKASPTSLTLTQNSPPVEDAVKEYTKTLASITAGKPRVVGYVIAINGEVIGADIYASAELFSAMWEKLLKSSAIEAVRLRDKRAVGTPPTSRVQAFLHEATGGKETTTNVDGRSKLFRRESERQLLVELRDEETWVHRSIVKK